MWNCSWAELDGVEGPAEVLRKGVEGLGKVLRYGDTQETEDKDYLYYAVLLVLQ